MFLRMWRFTTIILTALLMGMTFCHVLELSAKMNYDGSLYVTVQNSLYQQFGGPGIGAFMTLGAILTTAVLSFLVRKRRQVFYLTLTATVCLLLAFPVVFYLFTEPANIVFRNSTPESLPTDWMRLREQWEYSHAASFVLHLLAFSALVFSVLIEIPVNRSRIDSLKDCPRDRIA
ncbi:DUF1772 domain-containing protein [Nostoc minutum NIES-26]|uniref:DUF1772 domain-containing protein n=1 Tax=Nostoc minutum NIES-26 TaxID=1844469 RepID=A0A367RZ25_9NOSO|nr:DUF1772 domain-containing protein [Nostoc minutum NIES-26]